MPTVEMLSSKEQDEIKKQLEKYCTLDTDGDLTKYVTEMDVADGDVEIRFFPTPEQGPVEAIYFEVSVYDDVSWKDESLGAYSADNLQNGGEFYQQLDEELTGIIESVTGATPEFIMEKGCGAFTAKVSV